jgi:hypothetical protein
MRSGLWMASELVKNFSLLFYNCLVLLRRDGVCDSLLGLQYKRKILKEEGERSIKFIQDKI